MTALPFETSGLPAHPAVEKAFALRGEFLASGLMDPEAAKEALCLAKILKDSAVADPHIIAAALVMPVYLGYACDDAAVARRLAAGLDKTTLHYLDAHLRALHPFEVAESFQMLPVEQRHAAAAIITAMHIRQSRELPFDHMSAKEIRQAAEEIFRGGDPAMPPLQDYMIMGDVARRSPDLWAEAGRACAALETAAASKERVASRTFKGPRC